MFEDEDDIEMMLAGYPPEVRDYERALLSDDPWPDDEDEDDE